MEIRHMVILNLLLKKDVDELISTTINQKEWNPLAQRRNYQISILEKDYDKNIKDIIEEEDYERVFWTLIRDNTPTLENTF